MEYLQGCIVWLLLIAVAVLIIRECFRIKYVEISENDCLSVLSSTEWKTADTIRKEMEQNIGGRISKASVLANLGILHIHNLCESRYDPTPYLDLESYKPTEFRKKAGGQKLDPEEDEKIKTLVPQPA